jgi:hypothetical protein
MFTHEPAKLADVDPAKERYAGPASGGRVRPQSRPSTRRSHVSLSTPSGCQEVLGLIIFLVAGLIFALVKGGADAWKDRDMDG